MIRLVKRFNDERDDVFDIGQGGDDARALSQRCKSLGTRPLYRERIVTEPVLEVSKQVFGDRIGYGSSSRRERFC